MGVAENEVSRVMTDGGGCSPHGIGAVMMEVAADKVSRGNDETGGCSPHTWHGAVLVHYAPTASSWLQTRLVKWGQ